MRIGYNFHCFDSYLSGVEYYSLGLLRALLEFDPKSEFVVFTNRPEILKKYINECDNFKIRYCHLKTRLARISWEHLKLPGILKKEKLDVLHCPHYICPIFRSSVPYIVTVHDTIALDHPKMCKLSNAAYYKLYMKRSVANASRIIAVSGFTRDRIKYHFRRAAAKTIVIYPGIDEIFSTGLNLTICSSIKTKYRLPDKYILYSGNIEPKKNMLNLLKAFRLLKDQGLDHSLVITGQRRWRSGRVLDFLYSGFSEREVVLTGYINRNDLGTVYKMSDCLLLTSFCEGFGFPPFEAFACKVPVAATITGALGEIDVKAYSQIDPECPENIAAAIKALLNNSEFREQQIDIAYNIVKKFNWSQAASKTFQVYREATA